MSFAGCHDTLVVIVFHVVLQDLLEPGNGVWGIEKMEHGGTGIWGNGNTAYSPAFSYRKSIPDLKSWICANTVCVWWVGGECTNFILGDNHQFVRE